MSGYKTLAGEHLLITTFMVGLVCVYSDFVTIEREIIVVLIFLEFITNIADVTDSYAIKEVLKYDL